MPELRLPEHFLSANLILCEKVLRETDGIASAIRVVDVIRFDVPANQDPTKGRVDLSLFAQVKTDPGFSEKLSVQLYLVRPDGNRQPAGGPYAVNAATALPDSAGGFSVTGHIAIVTQQTGIHYLVLTVEGTDIAKTAFTLVLRREPIR